MESVRDLLIWYNNLDVEPFLEALQKQYAIYASRGIDMGRQAIRFTGSRRSLDGIRGGNATFEQRNVCGESRRHRY